MKLSKIAIQNYRGKNFDFQPGKLNFLFGKNGDGKTTLCDAIRYGITGLSPADDVRNMSVAITFGTGLKTERGKGKVTTCRVNNSKVTAEAMNSAIVDAIGISLTGTSANLKPEEVLRHMESVKIASSAELFLSLNPQELLKHMLPYIPEQLDFDTVIGYFKQANDAVIDQCSFIFPPMPETFGIEEIHKAYQSCFEERKDLNRKINEYNALIRSIHGTSPTRALAAVEADLANIMVVEKEQSNIQKKLNAYTEAKQRRTQQEAAIKQIKEKMNTLKSATKPDEKVLKTIEEERSIADNAKLKYTRNFATVNNNLELFRRTLAGLNTQSCPISEKLMCTTDKTEMHSEMEKAIKENEDLLQVITVAIKAEDEKIQKGISAKNEYEAQKQVYETYTRHSEQLKVYQENLIAIPEEPNAKINAADIAERKRFLADEKKNIESFQKKQKLEKELLELSESATTYNCIIQALGDKGEVKNGIINYYLSIFENVCNARAAEFSPGYELKFISDNGIRIQVKTPANNSVQPIEALSNGEKIIAAFILTDMLNQLSNSRLMFVDNIEALDSDALAHLRQLIEKPEFQDAYDHIFVCGVNHSDVMSVFKNMNATYLK